MKKVYIHRENIVDTNTYCSHDPDVFWNRKWDETCLAPRSHHGNGGNFQPRGALLINNSWVRNAHQYKTKAGGAISQVKHDQVIAVCSEAFSARVAAQKTFVPREPPVELDYTYATITRQSYKREASRSLYRRKSHKKTDTNLPKKYK